MTRIYSYKLQVRDVQTLEMPTGAEILSLQTQYDAPCLWAIVEPAAALESRRFRIFCTGDATEDVESMLYIGTFQIHFTGHAFHVFEVSA